MAPVDHLSCSPKLRPTSHRPRGQPTAPFPGAHSFLARDVGLVLVESGAWNAAEPQCWGLLPPCTTRPAGLLHSPLNQLLHTAAAVSLTAALWTRP